jgi:hypothetical protein
MCKHKLECVQHRPVILGRRGTLIIVEQLCLYLHLSSAHAPILREMSAKIIRQANPPPPREHRQLYDHLPLLADTEPWHQAPGESYAGVGNHRLTAAAVAPWSHQPGFAAHRRSYPPRRSAHIPPASHQSLTPAAGTAHRGSATTRPATPPLPSLAAHNPQPPSGRRHPDQPLRPRVIEIPNQGNPKP